MMKCTFALSVLVAVSCVMTDSSASTHRLVPSATAGDLQNAASWARAKFLGVGGPTEFWSDGTTEPFSFKFGGIESRHLLGKWTRKSSMVKSSDGRIKYFLTFVDPVTELRVACAGTQYPQYPTVEWIVTLQNLGLTPTPPIEDLRVVDIRLQRGPGGEFLLHSQWGDGVERAWGTVETTLDPGSARSFASVGGRPTNGQWPYYNIELPGKKGVILVLGWHGQWATNFTRDAGCGLSIQGSQELTHFRLLPGEKVRTPVAVLQFWSGDRIDSQNVWRRWMLAHNVPRPGGKLPGPMLHVNSTNWTWTAVTATEENQKELIRRYRDERIRVDTLWIDAGWYVNRMNAWEDLREVGTWEVDRRRFPGGLRPVADFAHSIGSKVILWFDPQRVWKDTWLYRVHPEWLLSAPYQETDAQGPGFLGVKLFNLGNPEARKWLTDHVDGLMKNEHIDIYRHDHNTDLLNYWRLNDEPDRRGITEIRDIEGNLAFWDELFRRDPDRLIDTCSSGGRRLDLETLRRAVPLWRSDAAFDPVAMQGQTYGLSFWVPYHGSGLDSTEPYRFRSQMFISLNSLIDVRDKSLDYDCLRRLLDEWRQVAHLYLADYYPLTSYSLDSDKWMAWQFNAPETGEGMVQAFRRIDCVDDSARLKLRGLDEYANYRVYDFDRRKASLISGRELAKNGLVVSISSKPGAALIRYRKIAPSFYSRMRRSLPLSRCHVWLPVRAPRTLHPRSGISAREQRSS